MMNADTIAGELLEGTGLSVIDLARLALETIEELGGRRRKNVLVRLRAVMRAGVQAVKDAERTVSFRKAAELSIEERRDLRPTSQRDIRHYVRRFLKDERFAARPLRAVSVRECRELLQREFGHSPSSFVKARAILSSVFSFGIRQEWCDANPVSRIAVPRVQETPIAPLTQEEIARLETTAEQPRFRAMKFSLHLLLYNGIRPTEVSRWHPELPQAHILPHWNWAGREGEVTPVMVFSSGDEAELFLNGKSQGVRRRGEGERFTQNKVELGKNDYRFVWEHVVYEPGTLEVVVKKNGKPWCRAVRRTTGPAVRVQMQADRPPLLPGQLAFVELSATDAQGEVVPTDNSPARFSIEGPAELLGFCNGDPTDPTAAQDNEQRFFHGRLLAIIRGKQGHGEIVLRVTTPTHGTHTLPLRVEERRAK